MLTNPITGLPYQDTFDPIKLYQAILFNNGVNLQSREMNELLSLLADRIKKVGNILFNDGAIVKGGGLIVAEDKLSVRMLPIEIFIAGIVHSLESVTVTITGVGTEILGIKLSQEIVTYLEDPTLLDPAIGLNSGLPGADRLKLTTSWVVNDPESFPVYTMSDGALKVEKYAPESDSIEAWLARRTNDESGSYTVTGLTGYVTEKDSEYFNLVVEAGKGYVQGKEIPKPVPVKTDLLKSVTTQAVTNETKTYNTGTLEYALNNQPVKEIDLVTAQVSKTITMTRGTTANGSDLIPEIYHPVSSITSITGYTTGTSYTLDGNSVNWSPGGAEPASGATYSITFVYTKTMVANTDYSLYRRTSDNKACVKFLSGDLPVNGSNFQVGYDFYLSRRDLFYLTKDGSIQIINGQPGLTPILPSGVVGVLTLGELYVPANCTYGQVIVTNYDPKRLTMSEIRGLRNRIDYIEYNAAIEDLDNAAAAMEPATLKKALFTDGFINTNKADYGQAGVSFSIDPARGVMMPKFIETTIDPVINLGNTTARVHSRTVTRQYTEVVGIEQTRATQRFNLNAYLVYNRSAKISVTPNQDSWINSSTVQNIVYRWWDVYRSQTVNTSNGTGQTSTSTSMVSTSTTVTVASSLIVDEATKLIRQRQLTVIGTAFEPGSDNLKCSFDGIQVTLTPAGIGTSGTIPGTMKADVNGSFSATFQIPPNIPTGTREIVVWNEV